MSTEATLLVIDDEPAVLAIVDRFAEPMPLRMSPTRRGFLAAIRQFENAWRKVHAQVGMPTKCRMPRRS